jgi:hypothetical protein
VALVGLLGLLRALRQQLAESGGRAGLRPVVRLSVSVQVRGWRKHRLGSLVVTFLDGCFVFEFKATPVLNLL